MTFTLAKQVKIQIALIVLGILSTVIALALTTGRAEAACSVDTSRGTVTQTFTVTQAGTYRIWARMGANPANAAHDSFYLEVDGGECINMGDTSVPTSGWKWVDYRDANTATKANTANLTAGTHTVKYIGKEDSVRLDKVLFLSGDTCTPTDMAGNPCITTTDTTPPANVSMTAPANNAQLSGSAALTATGTDNVGITGMTFYIGNTALGTDTTSPYSFSLNTLGYQNGTYNLSAEAADAAGNKTRSSNISVTINNPQPDTTAPQVSITSPQNNASVSAGSTTVNATATDNIGVTKVEFLVDGTVVSTDTSAPYTASLNLTAGTRSVVAKAYDAAGLTATSTISLTVTSTTPNPKACDFAGGTGGAPDGQVGIADLAVVLSKWGTTVTPGQNGDCGGGTGGAPDGQVGIADLGKLLALWGL